MGGDGWLDVSGRLSTRALARVLEVHDSIGSTNDRARELARGGAAHGLTVVARAQTQGRGQRGRSWHSPPGLGLYVSFIVRPELPSRRAPALTLLAGVAVREALESATGVRAMIKWPNDLLASAGPRYGLKLAGVLVEASADPTRLDHAVIGIGVNLREGARPPELADIATSLEALAPPDAPPPDVSAIVASIAGALEARLDEAETSGFDAILRDFARHAALLGREVSLRVDGEVVRGILSGVAEDGALVLTTGDGPRSYHRGELERPRASQDADDRA